MTMTRLTTTAMTGRRMNRSVSFMESPPVGSAARRVRGELRVGCERVVHGDRGPVAQLDRAAAHDGLARLEPRDHRDEVSAALSRPDELLADDGGPLAALVLRLDGEHRVAVWREHD